MSTPAIIAGLELKANDLRAKTDQGRQEIEQVADTLRANGEFSAASPVLSGMPAA